ncbi:MAG: DPP IV N-terminal domain-containing protein [Bryobacteraceae bacterium]
MDARTDVFSLGCVLYEMLTGCPVVPAGRLNEIITAMLHQQPTPLATLRPNCPVALVRIVDCTLERDRNRRYPTAQELLLDLKAVLNQSNAPSEAKSPRRLTSGMGFVFLALVLGLGTAFLALQRKQESPAEYSSVPLTSALGSALCPSFAPDGERVVFSWDGEKHDNPDIYVKQIRSGQPLRLTTDSRPDLSPAWSPDGQTIAFLRFSSPGKADLMLMPSSANGPERRIAEMIAPNEVYSRVRFLSWSPDGQWLVVPDGISADATAGLSLVSVHTGEKRRLTLPPPWNDDLSPALAPDSKHLVFARYTGQLVSDLYVLDLAKDLKPVGKPKPLTSYHQQTSSPAWMPDGRSVLFTRYSTHGSPGLWRMTFPAQSRPEPVPISAENAAWLAVSPKGDRLVYTHETANSNLWAVETPGSPLWRGRNSIFKSWITSSRQERTPQFSPDGQQIAFQSTRSGWSEIWIADRDGSHPRQLTDYKAAVAGFPHWSPDGAKIVFHLREQSQAKLFIQDVQGGRPHRLTAEPTDDYSPSWSHDGKWIYFSSPRSGTEQIWRVPATGGPATQITKRGGWAPTESADQRYLFYAKENPTGLWRMPITGGEEQLVVSNVAASGSAYALGQQGVYFIGSSDGGTGQQLAFLRFATGKVRSIANIPRPLELGLTVSPDEQILLYSQMDQVNSDIMLVEHFR